MTIGATPAHDDDPGAELAQHHGRATPSRTTIEASRLEIRHELDHHRLTPTMRRPILERRLRAPNHKRRPPIQWMAQGRKVTALLTPLWYH